MKRWTQTTISISNYEEPWSGYHVTLQWERETDRVSILINAQDIGAHIQLDQLKEQLAKWFAAMEETC